MRRAGAAAVLLAAVLAGCAAPRVATTPERLEPGVLAQRQAARPAPLSIEQIVQKSRAGVPAPTLIDELRQTGTRHALGADEAARLRAQGVDQAVLDELATLEANRARDQAAADKVRQQSAAIEAADRARAEAERRRREAYPPYYGPYYDPFWPHPYGYPGRFGWGLQYRR